MKKNKLFGRRKEVYDKIPKYVERKNSGLGTKITEIASALETSRRIVEEVSRMHKNLVVIECSRSNRVKGKDSNE